jgi:signal transduction histidine kinase
VQSLRQELGEKNRLLERKNRLAALGEMAAGMAHEIRNPLGGIQLYASILAKDVADRPQSLNVVLKIAQGVKSLEALVSQVLQFTREIVPVVVPADLAVVVSQSLELAAPQLQRQQATARVSGPSSLPVSIDPRLIGQAVLNLLINAAEALGDGGEIDIHYDRPSDGSARQFRLTITDTGPGIPPESMDRIFNPFYTTKESGTGLGLAIVHRVVEAHDGVVTACNAPDRGARFEVKI